MVASGTRLIVAGLHVNDLAGRGGIVAPRSGRVDHFWRAQAGHFSRALKPACMERVTLGQPCDGKQGDPCVAGATCDRLGTKTCVPAKKTGEACTAIEECEGYECEGGRCVPTGWFFDDVSCTH